MVLGKIWTMLECRTYLQPRAYAWSTFPRTLAIIERTRICLKKNVSDEHGWNTTSQPFPHIEKLALSLKNVFMIEANGNFQKCEKMFNWGEVGLFWHDIITDETVCFMITFSLGPPLPRICRLAHFRSNPTGIRKTKLKVQKKHGILEKSGPSRSSK